MRIKTISLVLLLALIITLPVSAYTARELASFSDSPVAIAWMEGNSVYVAIANESNVRQNYTIEVYDNHRRATLDRISTTVPSRTVLIEELNPKRTGNARFQISEVVIYSSNRTKTIVVQKDDLFEVKNYVVPANSNVTVGVDFAAIKGNSSQGRLVFDQTFRLSGNNRTGQITVSRFESGYNYTSWGNEINYSAPSLELGMRIPRMQGVSILSFGMTHYSDRFGARDFYYAPALIVYGDDFRLIDSSNAPEQSGDSGWVVR